MLATGRTLSVRQYHMTDDKGMQDMLSFLIARDTMHQQQWLAVLEELGQDHLPIPNTFPQKLENQDFNYSFFGTRREPQKDPNERWTTGRSIDDNGKFSFVNIEPQGEEPILGPARPDTFGEKEQLKP